MTIQSLIDQTRAPDEIIIVDDGSTDNSVEIAQAFPVRVIVHETNMGLAATRNTGIMAAKGDILLFIDVDAPADPNCLDVLLAQYSDESVGGVGGRNIESVIRSPYDRYRQLLLTQYIPPNYMARAPWVSGCCSSYRRSALFEIGGFDPFYRTNAEDNDIGARLNKAGYRIAYDPNAIVRHQKTDNWGSLNATAYRFCYWAARFIHRNRVRPHMAYHRILGGGILKGFRLLAGWRQLQLLPIHMTVVASKLWGYYQGNRDARLARNSELHIEHDHLMNGRGNPRGGSALPNT